jgi:hypothetical protein
MEFEMTHDVVLTALIQQVECYRHLAKLAMSQHDHVRASRTADLLSVLAQRQEMLDQIADLEQSVSPAKKRWTEYLNELPASDRAVAEQMMAESRRLLEEITTTDRNDALVLQQRKLNLGREIGLANAARRFNRKYAAAAYGPRAASLDIQR